MNESGYGQNVTNFLIAVGNNALAKSGGNFTLTADVNFGANFGLIAKYLKSNTLNIATTGTLRLAKTDTISIRNNANTADLAIGINGSDQLTFNGLVVPDVGSTVTLAGVQTLTNKTLSTGTVISAGKITTAVNEVDSTDATKQMAVSLAGAVTATTTTLVMSQTANRSITLPDATDTLVGKATVDTLINKTLTSPVLNTPTTSGEIIANYEDFTQVATPATPGAGVTRVYSKTDGKLYQKTSAGVESQLGGGGLSGVLATANVTTAVNGTMYECTSTGGFTITLPTIPAGGAVIGVMDAAGTCSATNFIRITPATGQSLDGYPVNDSVLMDYPGANTIAYAAAGATSWKLQKQATTMVAAGQLPASTTGVAIAAGYIGEYREALGTITAISANTYSATANAGLSLTPGVYDVQVFAQINPAATTTLAGITVFLSDTNTADSSNIDYQRNAFTSYHGNIANANGDSWRVSTPVVRVLVTATKTYYPKVYVNFGTSTCNANANIFARRVG